MALITLSVPTAGDLIKPAPLSTDIATIQTWANGNVDTLNISSKYCPSIVDLLLTPNRSVCRANCHVNSGTHILMGMSIDTGAAWSSGNVTIELITFDTATPGTVTQVAGSSIVLSAAGFQVLDITAASVTATKGFGVRVTAGTIAATDSIMVGVQLAPMLLKASEL